MKYTFLIILVLFSISISAQNNRVIYATEDDEGVTRLYRSDSIESKIEVIEEQKEILQIDTFFWELRTDSILSVSGVDTLGNDIIDFTGIDTTWFPVMFSNDSIRIDTTIIQPYLSKQDVAKQFAESWLSDVDNIVSKLQRQSDKLRQYKKTKRQLEKFIENPKIRKEKKEKVYTDADVIKFENLIKEGATRNDINREFKKSELIDILIKKQDD